MNKYAIWHIYILQIISNNPAIKTRIIYNIYNRQSFAQYCMKFITTKSCFKELTQIKSQIENCSQQE